MSNLEELEKTLKVKTKGQLSDTFSMYKWVQNLGLSIKNMFGWWAKKSWSSKAEKNQITLEMEQDEGNRSKSRWAQKT